jgi:hypothetical protein
MTDCAGFASIADAINQTHSGLMLGVRLPSLFIHIDNLSMAR